MGVTDISFRKRLALNLFQKHKAAEIKRHQLDYLMWECTLRCNLMCRHCGSDCRKDMAQKDMPLADFLQAIDQITPHVDPHRTMIVITGGEPLMRADLERCGRELYKREYPWGIVSNGFAMTKERLESLIASGLRSVTISLDGLQESHDAMRGHPDSFRRAFDAIKRLVEKEDEITFDVVTCVSAHTFSELPAVKEMLINAGVKRWRIFTIFPVGRASQFTDLQLPPEKFKQLFDFIRETRREGRIKLSYGCEGFLGSYETEVRDHFFFCRAGITVGSILVDGSISACPSIRANFTQGNIYNDHFMEVWNNRYQPFRNREWAKKGECADCNYFRYCQGNGIHLRDENGKLLFCHLKRLQEADGSLL